MDTDYEWRAGASCIEHDPEVFFPAGTMGASAAVIAEAKSICTGCPVQAQCLAYAVTTAQRFGVWGGTDEEERRLIRRRYVAAVRSGRDPHPVLAASA
jgi:WhiB family redox-sensing transcriptional regulator